MKFRTGENRIRILGTALAFMLFVSASVLPASAAEEQAIENGLRVDFESMERYNALENTLSYLSYWDYLGQERRSNENVGLENKLMARADEIIKEYEESKNMSRDIMDKLERKNELESLLIGRRLGALRYELVQIKGSFYKLLDLTGRIESYPLKNKLNIQIAEIEEKKEKVENFLRLEENKFSLFGWFVSIL